MEIALIPKVDKPDAVAAAERLREVLSAESINAQLLDSPSPAVLAALRPDLVAALAAMARQSMLQNQGGAYAGRPASALQSPMMASEAVKMSTDGPAQSEVQVFINKSVQYDYNYRRQDLPQGLLPRPSHLPSNRPAVPLVQGACP